MDNLESKMKNRLISTEEVWINKHVLGWMDSARNLMWVCFMPNQACQLSPWMVSVVSMNGKVRKY